VSYKNDKLECPRGEIGRHKGLKIFYQENLRKPH